MRMSGVANPAQTLGRVFLSIVWNPRGIFSQRLATKCETGQPEAIACDLPAFRRLLRPEPAQKADDAERFMEARGRSWASKAGPEQRQRGAKRRHFVDRKTLEMNHVEKGGYLRTRFHNWFGPSLFANFERRVSRPNTRVLLRYAAGLFLIF
jgi:hypothetical protein